MSRGYDYQERDDDREEELKQATVDHSPVTQSRGGGSSEVPEKDRLRSQGEGGRSRGLQRDRGTWSRERFDVRYGRQVYNWSELERAVMVEVGRFRTMDESDVQRAFYGGVERPFQEDLRHLARQGLIERRSIAVGKNRDIRHVLVLSKYGKKLVDRQGDVERAQAIYSGFVKPSEASHDASIYQMYEAEAKEIEGRGGAIRRVVLDFEFKKKIYAELNKGGDYGELSYARRQEELASLYELPMVDGKLALPDLRIEYETAEGDRAHIDLELATEHYRPGHMSQKTRAGFKLYGVNTTSRGRRAGWEGKELTADVLSI
jgi:hypothetical protein